MSFIFTPVIDGDSDIFHVGRVSFFSFTRSRSKSFDKGRIRRPKFKFEIHWMERGGGGGIILLYLLLIIISKGVILTESAVRNF